MYKSFDSYPFLSSKLDSLVKTHVDNNQKTLKNFKKESVGKDIIIKSVKEIETLISEDKNIEDKKKDLAKEIEQIRRSKK